MEGCLNAQTVHSARVRLKGDAYTQKTADA